MNEKNTEWCYSFNLFDFFHHHLLPVQRQKKCGFASQSGGSLKCIKIGWSFGVSERLWQKGKKNWSLEASVINPVHFIFSIPAASGSQHFLFFFFFFCKFFLSMNGKRFSSWFHPVNFYVQCGASHTLKTTIHMALYMRMKHINLILIILLAEPEDSVTYQLGAK